MGNELYWVSALSYAVVLIIILAGDILTKRKLSRLEYSFQIMVSGVAFFCVQDAIWGMCESGIIRNDTIFFVSSEVFHASTVVIAFIWLNFVLTYLEIGKKGRKIALILDGSIVIFQLILLIMNIYKPTVFSVVEGEYKVAFLRPLAFFNQYVVFLLTSCFSLVSYLKDRGIQKHRYFTVFIFTLFQLILGVYQFLYLDGPFYSLGYFLGCFVVYIFIVAKDREQIEKSNIMCSIAETFFSMHLLDLEEDSVVKYIEPEFLTNILGNLTGAKMMVDVAFRKIVADEYRETVMEFVNLNTLDERMQGSKHISCEFIGKDYGWSRVTYVAVERHDGHLKKVMMITEVIDEEKRNEIDLIYQSNNDELTGIGNRRAYERDIDDYRNYISDQNLVFVSMDVNGLKAVNDCLGHEAGDELLVGAAECMKRAFSSYGKIYRMGGDEFNALIYVDSDELRRVKETFEDYVKNWRGKLVRELSVSAGYVCWEDLKEKKIHEMSVLADRRMYEAKAEHYRSKGIDRRRIQN